MKRCLNVIGRATALGLLALGACQTVSDTGDVGDVTCREKTPMPEFSISQETETRADYLGVRTGRWDGDLCSTVAVTDIEENSATVIYSWGPGLQGVDAGFMRTTGTFKNGWLEVPLETAQVAYTLDGEALDGKYTNAAGEVFRGTFK